MARGDCVRRQSMLGACGAVRVVALAWPRQACGSCLPALCHPEIDHESPKRRIAKPPTLRSFPCFCVMATSARLLSSMRRSALSVRSAPRTQCLRLAPQVRRITSATSEPHQPDSKGGLDGPAPAKTIKFTSESYVAMTGNKIDTQYLTPADTLKLREIRNLLSLQKSM